MSSARELWRELDAARASLYTLFAAHDSDALATRPASGEWSAVENARHLLYAEEKHLGQLLPAGFRWSTIGLPTAGRPTRSGAGTEATKDLAEVLAAWDAVHASVRLDAVTEEQAARALDRNLRHLRAHTRTIQTLLGLR